MNKLEAVKTVAGIVISVGVGAVVGNAIKATTPNDITAVGKVAVAIGAFAVTGYLAMQSSAQTEATIQQIADRVTDELVKEDIPIEVIDQILPPAE